MLTSIHIQGFKGFKDTRIEPLRKVNLVLGGQNVGKTSLLEAVYVAAKNDINYAGTVFRKGEGGDLSRFRNSVFGAAFGHVELLSGDTKGKCILRGSTLLNSKLSWSWSTGLDDISCYSAGDWSGFNISPLPISIFIPDAKPLNDLFGKVVLARKKDELLDLLKKIESRLISLHDISPDGESRIYAELSDVENTLPIHQLGHGFSRLLYLYASLLTTNSQLALIDEVENGIHYSALPVLMQGIKNVAQQRDVQTIMTTHSWDCIRAACEVFADSPQDFQVIRLERVEDNVQAVCIEGEQLLRMVANDREVR